jgi:hypothetical protein
VVIHDCDRYPFVYPVALAVWQGVFGIGEAQARALGRFMLVLLILLTIPLALYLARRPVGSAPRPRSHLIDVVLLVVLAGLASPLARRYGPTLFLEIPAVVLMAATLVSWISRRDLTTGTGQRARRDLLTGLLVALTFFTKFNYALLLAAALGADAFVELIVARRRRHALLSLLWVAAPVLMGLAWWFVLPVPMGQNAAAEHRLNFMEFVQGNQSHATTPWTRKMNWLTGISAHPFLFAALIVFSLGLIAVQRTRTSVTFLFALVAFVVPILLHNYQLDRFLLPAAVTFWVAGGTSAAIFLRRFPRTFSLGAVALAALCAAFPALEVLGWEPVRLPVAPLGSPIRELQQNHVHSTLGLYGPPASNGMHRATHDKLMDMLAAAVGPEDSVGWLGQSAEVSPASLHVELLRRGGSRDRFLQYAAVPMDIVPVPSGVRIDFTHDELLDYVRRFDHVIVPFHGDLIDRPGRRWIKDAWHLPLRESALTEWQTIGSILVERFNETPLPVTFELVRAVDGSADEDKQ